MNYFAIFRLIGLLIVFLGLTMFLPVAWSLHFEDQFATPLTWAAFITLTTGGILYSLGSLRKQDVYRKEALAVVDRATVTRFESGLASRRSQRRSR